MRAPDELEVDAEPLGVELDDLAHDRLEALVHPHERQAGAVLDGELDEEVLLRAEVVEDRATGEADLLLEACDGRALVAVLGEAAASAGQDLLPPLGPALLGDLRHALALYKTVRTFYITAP